MQRLRDSELNWGVKRIKMSPTIKCSIDNVNLWTPALYSSDLADTTTQFSNGARQQSRLFPVPDLQPFSSAIPAGRAREFVELWREKRARTP